VDRIERFPEAWHPLSEGIRRCRLGRFPYGLIYAMDNSDIVVLAVAHLHRRPDYWRDRLK
jgi:toxin ParE2